MIGPNGSGKTTTMRMIAGLTNPDSGVISLFGESDNLDSVRNRVSFMIEAPYIERSMTAQQNMEYMSAVRGVNNPGRIKEILEFAVVMVHICITSVLLSMAVHSLLAPLLIWFRFEIMEGFINMLLPQIMGDVMGCSAKTVENFSNCFVVSQIGSVFSGEIDADLVLAVVLSLVVETLLWYFVATISFKRKRF